MEDKYKTIISADTAGSAKDLADGKDKTIAAISPVNFLIKFFDKIFMNPARQII